MGHIARLSKLLALKWFQVNLFHFIGTTRAPITVFSCFKRFLRIRHWRVVLFHCSWSCLANRKSSLVLLFFLFFQKSLYILHYRPIKFLIKNFLTRGFLSLMTFIHVFFIRSFLRAFLHIDLIDLFNSFESHFSLRLILFHWYLVLFLALISLLFTLFNWLINFLNRFYMFWLIYWWNFFKIELSFLIFQYFLHHFLTIMSFWRLLFRIRVIMTLLNLRLIYRKGAFLTW